MTTSQVDNIITTEQQNSFQASQANAQHNQVIEKKTFTVSLSKICDEPIIKVKKYFPEEDGISIVVETPKPLFFYGEYYAYHLSCSNAHTFHGQSIDECLLEAQVWAKYLLSYEEDRCYSATGPIINPLFNEQ